MDRFDAMRAFARVVETGSFTKAADSLQLSKTTVTQLVQQLEAHLRVQLLHRSTRKLRVSADGAAFYERVLRLLADLEEAETCLAGAAATPRGRLRVDLPSPLARLLLIPALPDFQARYPEIQIEMGVSDRIVDLIADDVDCVLRGGELADLSLVARRVGVLPLGLYAAPAWLQRHAVPLHPRELAQTPARMVGFLSARSGKPLPLQMRREAEALTLTGRHLLAVDDGNAYLAAGLAGLGIVALPRYMAEPHRAAGELQALFADWELAPMPLHLAYRPSRYQGATLRAFVDWVCELLARPGLLAGRS